MPDSGPKEAERQVISCPQQPGKTGHDAKRLLLEVITRAYSGRYSVYCDGKLCAPYSGPIDQTD